MVEAFMKVYRENRNIFVMGNGGSGSIASHWAGDINKGCCFRLDKKFKMICLHDNISTMMAYANDLSYEQAFVEPLKNFFRPKDMVIGISGSGNSKNVLNAIEYANSHHGITIGLCGYGGGKLRDMVTIPLWVQADDMQKIEDVAMIIVHMAMQAICKELSVEETCGDRSAGLNQIHLSGC
jgi:D-sedoheptulose 7-phosphate isomerase